MLSSNQIKHIQSLRMKKFRDQHGLFMAEGDKIVRELLGGPLEVDMLCALPEWISRWRAQIPKELTCHEVDQKTLGRLSTSRSPNQALAVVRQPAYELPSSFDKKDLILLLDTIQDPGNLGSIIRTADWFGIRHVLCSHNTADIYNPKVIQATMGSFIRTKVYYTDLARVMREHKGQMFFYGTFIDGKNVFDTAVRLPAAIVIGNESRGITEEIARFVDQRIGIPSGSHTDISGAESLNAGIAAGIMMACFRHMTG